MGRRWGGCCRGQEVGEGWEWYSVGDGVYIYGLLRGWITYTWVLEGRERRGWRCREMFVEGQAWDGRSRITLSVARGLR